jgi:DNA invertase Pin-like site-specific DNA recombinase
LTVHLLEVYSNPAMSRLRPQELIVRSAADEEREPTAALKRIQARQLRSVEVRRLVARYLETGNLRQVARELGISRTTVAKELAAQGIDTSVGMKPNDIHRAVDLCQQVLSSGKI